MGLARGHHSAIVGFSLLNISQWSTAMPNSQEIEAKSDSPVPQGYVLGAEAGEHLIHFRDGGNIFIKVDPVTGSNNFGLGTQQLPKGSGIPVHRHLHKDEAFYVLEGSGMVTLNDVCHPCERGGTIFIPKNAWHGFSSPDQELVLLWIMVPRRLLSRNLQPTRRTAKGIDAGADQRDRSQIWARIQIGGVRDLPTRQRR
jgi:quercetin dioxygenase-like cupin family protein